MENENIGRAEHWYIGTRPPRAERASPVGTALRPVCSPCAGDRCACPGVRRSCGTAWRACEHGAPPDLRARDETVLVFVDTDEDLDEMMELALEVRLGARHVHARVAQRRREGRHLREVAVGQVGVVLCEAAGGGACRLRPVDGRYVLAKQQLWLAVVPASSRVPRGRHAPASSVAFKQGLFGSRHFVTQRTSSAPCLPPRPPPHLVLPPPRPLPLSRCLFL